MSVSCNNTTNEPVKTGNADPVTGTPTVASPSQQIVGSAGTLFVDDAGNGGIPLLFVHSFGGSTKNWQNQLEHLRKDCRVIAMDLRGHGQSAAPADTNYTVGALESDIEAVADSLHLAKFILVGHSMGGAAAIAYAAAHPDRLAALVLTGTPGKTPEKQYKPILASLETDSSYQKVMDSYMMKLLTNATPATRDEINAGMSNISKEASLHIIRSIFAFDPSSSLNKYTGPALIISTEGESQANSLHELFPGIEHIVIKGTSHWAQLDKPTEFNAALDNFLKKIPSK